MCSEKLDQDEEFGYAVGMYSVTAFLANRSECVEAFLYDKERFDAGIMLLAEYAKAKGIPSIAVSSDELETIKKERTIAVKFRKFDDQIDSDKPHILLANLKNPGNIGAIIRSAVCMGIRNIILVRPCADPFDLNSVLSSVGCITKANIHTVDSLTEYRTEFPQHKLYCFMIPAEQKLCEVKAQDVPEKFTLVFGNEDFGLSEEYERESNRIMIPMEDDCNSLNVSATAAIAIYNFQQLIQKGKNENG